MSKFGLEPEEDAGGGASNSLADRLASFPLAAPRHRLDLVAVDAAAAPHGFVSREVSPVQGSSTGRRRRLGVPEPTRHLAIRLTMAQYERFVGYADQHQLTYQDALVKLLNDSAASGDR